MIINAVMSYIKVNNASVIYNEGSDNQVNALSDVSLRIDQNEFVIFFGPSGCGKTTLLNLISGLEKPSDGQVVIDGKDVAVLDADQMARFHCDKIGMVFQAYNLIPSLSVIDNVILPRIFGGGLEKRGRKEKARQLLEKFGVLQQADKFPVQLSGGQQQRVAIARSLINDQPIILADEPVGNLDSKSAENVLTLLRELNENEHKTIIMVTHNAEHLAFADHIFYLKDGKITDEVFSRKKKTANLADLKPQEREFELLSRSFSGLSEAQMNVLIAPFKAKVLVQYLTNALDFNQNQRLEEIMTKRLSEEVSADRLGLLLDKPYEKGGIGLNFQTAKNYYEAVEELLRNVRMLQPDLSALAAKLQISETELKAKLIVCILAKKYPADFSVEQIKIVEKIIIDRLDGRIDNQMLCSALDVPAKEGGAGMDLRIARRITQEIEMMLLLKFSYAHKNSLSDEKHLSDDQKKQYEIILGNIGHMEELINSQS